MNEPLKHEKVRFRRGEIRRLETYASAVACGVPDRAKSRGRFGRMIRLSAIGICSLVVLAVLAVYAVTASGFGAARLEQAATAALERIGGPQLVTRFGRVGVSLDGWHLLAIEVGNAEITTPEGERVMSFDTVRFGLRILPLLRGEIVPAQLDVAQARVKMAALPIGQGAEFDPSWLDEPIDPDMANAAVFRWGHILQEQIVRSGADTLRLTDVSFVVGRDEAARTLRIDEATLSRDRGGEVAFAMQAGWEGRDIVVDTVLTHDDPSDLISQMRLSLAASALPEDSPALAGSHFGAVELEIDGRESTPGAGQLRLDATVNALTLDLGDGDRIVADATIDAESISGSGKLEINRADVVSGGSRWLFNGAFGPPPAAADGSAVADYRFELVSDGSTIAPAGVEEPPMEAALRVAGRVDINGGERRINVDEIRMRTANGALAGNLEVILQPQKTPGLDLALSVFEMPVGEVKQVWPWFAARGARNWVMQNVSGGEVARGGIALKVPPGRLGNGVALDGEEVFGHFDIAGTTFNVAGAIPPVNDGEGRVAFRGSDVDIDFNAGTVHMAGDRSVSARGGTLKIRHVPGMPLIGDLDIRVAGAAPAVMQLAGYEPIDATRLIDFDADDLSGEVTGTVRADIPLQNGIAPESLDWQVLLDYKGVSLAKPFEGQRVSDADGTIDVTPQRAVIEAKARLNGVPATLRLVEPVGRGTVDRERRIALQLDDRARRELVPGLDMLLSGTAAIELEELGGGRRTVKADLGGSQLSVPWINWSKGSGIGASASFLMAMNGNDAQLNDFRLSGESFSVSGEMALRNGAVTHARFPSVRMNRNDDFSVDVRAQGGGYAVTVRGKAADARSVVKMVLDDDDGAEGGGSASTEGVPVSVDLELDTLSGFHGEALSNVRLSYRGTGSRIEEMRFSGITRNGNPVSYTDNTTNGVRSIELQSADAGSVLRFLDVYEHMQGGAIRLALSGAPGGALRGQMDARDFWVVNEPRLSSIVSTPASSDGRSLNQAVRGELDTSRVQFERAFSLIDKGPGYLALDRGILRGPMVGASFQGTWFDRAGNMAMTGTFMPAYGINRLFGEIPIIGQILGNGRDRGLIGITFRLAGNASDPQLEINPLSVIAPGIFRSVFEYR